MSEDKEDLYKPRPKTIKCDRTGECQDLSTEGYCQNLRGHKCKWSREITK